MAFPFAIAAALAIQAISAAAGQKQLGGIAPQSQPGESLGVGSTGGGLFDTLKAIQSFAPEQQDLTDLVGTQGQELPSQPRPGDFVGSTIIPEEVGVPESRAGSGQQQLGPFGSFFGNLDQNLQSPSKVLGLGLLNQLDPRLAGLGLFAGGLFGQNKLFGGN